MPLTGRAERPRLIVHDIRANQSIATPNAGGEITEQIRYDLKKAGVLKCPALLFSFQKPEDEQEFCEGNRVPVDIDTMQGLSENLTPFIEQETASSMTVDQVPVRDKERESGTAGWIENTER